MVALTLATPIGSLVRPVATRSAFRARAAASGRLVVRAMVQKEQNNGHEARNVALLAAAGLLAPLVLDADAAQAVPELLKGRTFSLIHPGELEKEWIPLSLEICYSMHAVQVRHRALEALPPLCIPPGKSLLTLLCPFSVLLSSRDVRSVWHVAVRGVAGIPMAAHARACGRDQGPQGTAASAWRGWHAPAFASGHAGVMGGHHF